MSALQGLLAGGNRALVALILLLPARQGAVYQTLTRLYHGATFVYCHRRLPSAPGVRFNDFLFALKTGNGLRDPLRKNVTDKALGKDYIAARVGPGCTVATLAVLHDDAEIAAFRPPVFPVVLKPTHSSGKILVVQDAAAMDAAQPTLRAWLRHDYFRQTLEDNYDGLAKKIIVEPYIDDALYLEGSIHCRAGRAKIISIIDRFDTSKKRASLTCDWQHLHVALGQPYHPFDLPPPVFLADLLEKTEAIARDFPSIRVDFYASDTAFVFGELTNLPGGGLARFSSADGEARFSAAFFS